MFSIIHFQFPEYISQQSPSTAEASPLVEYTEDSIDHQESDPTNHKWNNFVVNLNGGIKKATVLPTKELPSPLPYMVAPSFEKRWPQNGVAPQVNISCRGFAVKKNM